MADSYYSHFCWEECTGLSGRWRGTPYVFAHKKWIIDLEAEAVLEKEHVNFVQGFVGN